MSGLQASISTHIAQQYFYADGRSGTNIPLFVRAVGSHPDRMSNLYFTFLFVLRAVTKAGSVLTDYPFHTGQTNDDRMVRNLIRTLVDHRLLLASGDSFNEVSTERTRGFQNADWNKNKNELEQCRKGFDESVLFQVRMNWIDLRVSVINSSFPTPYDCPYSMVKQTCHRILHLGASQLVAWRFTA